MESLLQRLRGEEVVKIALACRLTDTLREEHPTAFSELLQLLPRCTRITYVLLDRDFVSTTTSDELSALMQVFGRLPKLEEICFHRGRIQLGVVCRALQSCPNLLRLGLSMICLGDLGDCQGLAHHPSLKGMYLSEFQIANVMEQSLNTFFHALSTCPCLENIEMFSSRCEDRSWTAGLSILAESRSLKSLTLRRVGFASPFGLAIALQENHATSALKHLDLSGNNMGNDGSAAVVQSVASHPALRSLALRENSITEDGCRAIVRILVSAAQGALRPIDEPVDVETGGFVRRGCVLEKLNLTANQIGNGGAIALVDLLAHCPNLLNLELARTGIADVGAVSLAKALDENRTLNELGLAHNELTTDSYLAFAAALKVNNTLSSVNLISNRGPLIQTRGYVALVEMLETNFAIQNISSMVGDRSKSLGRMVNSYLRLNRAGRKRLLCEEPPAVKEDWVEAMIQCNKDVHALYYLLQANPTICYSS